jgi:hypothetical protein
MSQNATLNVNAGFFDNEHTQTFVLSVQRELTRTLRDIVSRLPYNVDSAKKSDMVRRCMLRFRDITDTQEREETALLLQRDAAFDSLAKVVLFLYAQQLTHDDALRVAVLLPPPARFMHSVYVRIADLCDPIWWHETIDKTSARIVLLDAVRSACAEYVRIDPQYDPPERSSASPLPDAAKTDENKSATIKVDDVAPEDSISNVDVRHVDTGSAIALGKWAGLDVDTIMPAI